jgi:two-component system, NarL family, sensor kinase
VLAEVDNPSTMNRSPFVLATTRAAVVLAVVFAAAAVILAVGPAPSVRSVAIAVIAVGFLSVPLVGSGIARSEPRNPVGWILLASGAFLPLAAAAYLYARVVFEVGDHLPGASWAGWLDGWPWVPALALLPTIGLLIFPNGRLPSARWRPVLVAGWVVVAAITVALVLGTGLLDFPDRANPTALPGRAGSIAGALVACVGVIAPLSTLSAWSIHVRLRSVGPREGQALRLVTPAAWLIAASWWFAIAITIVTGDSVNALPLQGIGVLALAATAWAAIRRYRLFDTQLVFSRALLFGSLSVCVVAVYLLVGALVQLLASTAVSSSVAVVAAVLLALPLRDVLARAANRVVYGFRDDPYGAMVRLGQRLEDAAAPEDVLPAVARNVQDALRIPYVAIEIGDSRTEFGRGGDAPRESFPLVFAGETIGMLVAEQREADLPFTTAERMLLRGITHQVAAAGRAAALTQDLLRSRERLVAATEEERRRLRRDLHDGLGPGLAGVVLGLQRARQRLRTDPVDAGEQLDELTRQTQDAIAEVRRLVYDLRPSALDELGLVGALTERARWLGPFTVHGPDEPLQLPAAVEAAAYRIALEAMTNTVRHAAATHGRVLVRVDDSLHLEISDNGCGLPAGFRAGVGIMSMRERAAELGGRCVVERGDPVGTLICATIPLRMPREGGR